MIKCNHNGNERDCTVEEIDQKDSETSIWHCRVCDKKFVVPMSTEYDFDEIEEVEV